MYHTDQNYNRKDEINPNIFCKVQDLGLPTLFFFHIQRQFLLYRLFFTLYLFLSDMILANHLIVTFLFRFLFPISDKPHIFIFVNSIINHLLQLLGLSFKAWISEYLQPHKAEEWINWGWKQNQYSIYKQYPYLFVLKVMDFILKYHEQKWLYYEKCNSTKHITKDTMFWCLSGKCPGT